MACRSAKVASAPRQAAAANASAPAAAPSAAAASAAAAAAPAATAPAATASSATATTSSAAATAGELHVVGRKPLHGVLVEEVKGGQRDAGDFLIAQHHLAAEVVARRHYRHARRDAARRSGQGHARNSYRRGGLTQRPAF